jgi:FkbM family methyltransferase
MGKSLTQRTDELLMSVCVKLMSALSKRMKADIFLKLGQEFNVETATLKTKLGSFEGYLKDSGLFKYAISDGAWAQHIISLLNSFGKDQSLIFVDIGANIGLVCIPMARQNSNMSVVAIEPNPDCFDLLQKNVKRSELGNITLINKAIFERRDSVSFELSDDNFGDGRLRLKSDPLRREHFNESKRKTIQVECLPLDEIIGADIRGPLLIKADAQGAEVFLTNGGMQTMAKTGILIMEFWPYGISRLGLKPLDLFEELKQFFEYGSEVPEFLKNSRWMPMQELQETIVAYCSDQSNYKGIDLILAKGAFIQK